MGIPRPAEVLGLWNKSSRQTGTGAVQPQSYSKMPRDLLCLPKLWAPLTVLPRPWHLRQLREGAEEGPRRKAGPAGLLVSALLWAQGGRALA